MRYAVLTETTVVAKKQLNSTVLADGLFFSGKLSQEAIARTSDAVKEFCDCAKAEKVDNIFVFATVRHRRRELRNCERQKREYNLFEKRACWLRAFARWRERRTRPRG